MICQLVGRKIEKEEPIDDIRGFIGTKGKVTVEERENSDYTQVTKFVRDKSQDKKKKAKPAAAEADDDIPF
jgi:hypothetical protein